MSKKYASPKLTIYGNVTNLTKGLAKGGGPEQGQSTGGGFSESFP